MSLKRYFSGISLLLLIGFSLAHAETCDVPRGFFLLNQPNPSLTEIKALLRICDDSIIPDDAQTLLLHGLLARKEHTGDRDFKTAIFWLEKAHAANPDDNTPALELAVTYEWSNAALKAQAIYRSILARSPELRSALLGLARTDLATNDLASARTIYSTMLKANASDVDALNGMARVLMASAQFAEAMRYFEHVLTIEPRNTEASIGLAQIKEIPLEHVQVDSPPVVKLCDAAQGLILINKNPPLLPEVQRILAQCEFVKQDDSTFFLLYGLYERARNNNSQSLFWLKKAEAAAVNGDIIPTLELAVTYERLHQFAEAEAIYDRVLISTPHLRVALLGKARLAFWQKRDAAAFSIYNVLLKKNSDDIDALNGLGQIQLSQKNYKQANKYFDRVLHLQPQNAIATLGLKQLAAALVKPEIKTSPCNADEGLALLSKKELPLQKIQHILAFCDRYAPRDVNVLMLHGLLARKQKNYPQAIQWFIEARALAPAQNLVPAQELALTYEWSLQLDKAKTIYSALLAKHPNSRVALLGMARVEAAEYKIHDADLIYTHLLALNPHDVDALNGMGRLKMTDNQFKQAQLYFDQALKLQPDNQDVLLGLQQLNTATRYMLSFNQGQYQVLGQHSNSSVLYGYANISATDKVIAIVTHNSKQLNLDIPTQPGMLPNNSFFGGFQRQIPGKYGWGLNFDMRQHNDFPLEHRAGANANVYLLSTVQWFGGLWSGFSSPWNNQLYYSGFTLYTSLPFNISATAFESHEQLGGSAESYSFDLGKEFAFNSFYNIGTSYNATQKFWGYHGRVILPILKDQALEGAAEHYDFNRITIFSLGWRVYWG